LQASTVVDGGVEVLLKGLWPIPQRHLGQVLDIHLDSSSWDSHGIALRLLARTRAALLDQALPLKDPVDPVNTEVNALLGQVVGQSPGAVTSLTPKGYDALHDGLRNRAGVSVRPSRAVLEGMEVPI
jgi:hypothetical protein